MGLTTWVRTLFLSTLCIIATAAVISGCGSGGSTPGPLPLDGLSGASSTGGSTSGSTSGSEGLVCSDTTYSPNYVDENDSVTGLHNRLYHWSRFPVRVYFVSSDLSTPDRQAQAQQGFNWWVQTIPGISYTVVTDPNQADIKVQFQDRGQTSYGAITDYHTNNNHLVDATITFNMTYLSGIATITPVAAHEFGHALGIAGHSNHDGDVMQSSPEVYNLGQLSTRDTNTMQTAYCGIIPPASKTATVSAPSSQAGEVLCSVGVTTH